MAVNGSAEIIVVLLSLLYPVIAHTDFYHRPTSRSSSRPYTNDPSPRNEYSDFNPAPTSSHTTRRTSGKQRQHDDGLIVYPEAPTCAYGLCFNVAGYPKDQIQRILSRSQFADSYFEVSEEPVSIDNRFNTDEMALCETKVHTIYPEKANNTKKIERLIVNVEGGKQGIVFETCINNGKCKFSSNFPTGYASYCKQKYIHKKLMVLGDNDKFVWDSFEVPSCCVCTVARTD